MYSVVINNSLIDGRCITELLDKKVCGSYKDVFELIRDRDIPEDISERNAVKIREAKDHIADLIEAYHKYESIIRKNNIKVISDDSDNYPDIWKGLSGMPKVIYLRGREDALKKIDECGAVSVVGSREPGRYSEYATREFVTKLAAKGLVTVSGMALGIDRAAHMAAMDAGGVTVAVMPGGCEQIYPSQNRDVYERIIKGGSAVISEMPPDSGVKKQYFPSRNRLISALSDCCLIMEAGEYSGTLHTASFAAVQGRDVYVLPNNIYADNCIGGLKLIKDGAYILLSDKDVIDSVAEKLLVRKVDAVLSRGTGHEGIDTALIRKELDRDPASVSDKDVGFIIRDELSIKNMSADEICSRLKMPFYRVSQILSELELDGLVQMERGKYSLTMSL